MICWTAVFLRGNCTRWHRDKSGGGQGLSTDIRGHHDMQGSFVLHANMPTDFPWRLRSVLWPSWHTPFSAVCSVELCLPWAYRPSHGNGTRARHAPFELETDKGGVWDGGFDKWPPGKGAEMCGHRRKKARGKGRGWWEWIPGSPAQSQALGFMRSQ